MEKKEVSGMRITVIGCGRWGTRSNDSRTLPSRVRLSVVTEQITERENVDANF